MRYIIIILLCFVCRVVLSQPIMLHCDKAVYTAGDIIWFKAYLPSTENYQGNTFKLVLNTPRLEPFTYFFKKTDATGQIDGYFNIPFDISSGIYRLHIIGFSKVNGAEEILADFTIPIVNDLNTEENFAFPTKQIHRENELSVEIQLKNDRVESRIDQPFEIHVLDENGDPVEAGLSISIRDAEMLKTYNTETVKNNEIAAPVDQVWVDTLFYSGMVYDTAGTPRPEKVLCGFLPNSNNFIYADAQSNGEFYTLITDFQDQQTVQFCNYENTAILTKLRQNNMQGQATPDSLAYISIDDFITTSQNRKAIYNLFGGFEAIVPDNTAPSATTQDEPDVSIDMNEYSNFEDLPTFFREVVTPLKFKKNKDGGYTAKIFDGTYGNRRYLKSAPIFILNGQLTRDADFISQLEIKDIERINIYSTLKTLIKKHGLIANGGIVSIKINDPDLRVPTIEAQNRHTIYGYQRPLSYTESFESPTALNSPFIRSVLYWNPTAKTDKSGKFAHVFQQTDDKSTFVIEVVARDASGRWGRTYINYTT